MKPDEKIVKALHAYLEILASTHPDIDALLTTLSGKDRVTTIQDHQCTWCTNPNFQWRDEVSRREYFISGMCQNCQDIGFSQAEE